MCGGGIEGWRSGDSRGPGIVRGCPLKDSPGRLMSVGSSMTHWRQSEPRAAPSCEVAGEAVAAACPRDWHDADSIFLADEANFGQRIAVRPIKRHAANEGVLRICTSVRVVVYNQQVGEPSGRRTMAV